MMHFIMKNNIGSVTVVDRMLEIASLVLAIFLIVLAVALHHYLPEHIPIHFNAVGEADGWGDKSTIFVLSALGVVTMAICSLAAYNYKMVNLPFPLNPACLSQQVTIIGRMMRILSVLCGLLFCALLLLTTVPQWGMQSVFFPSFLIVMAAMIVVLIIYAVLVYKKGRNYP